MFHKCVISISRSRIIFLSLSLSRALETRQALGKIVDKGRNNSQGSLIVHPWPLSRDCAALNKNKSAAFVSGPLYATARHSLSFCLSLSLQNSELITRILHLRGFSSPRIPRNVSSLSLSLYIYLSILFLSFSHVPPPRVIRRVYVQLRLSRGNEHRRSPSSDRLSGN